jgi:hypothetical protein
VMPPMRCGASWCGGSPRRHDAADMAQPQAAGVRALSSLRHRISELLWSALVLDRLRTGSKAPCWECATQAPERGKDPAVTGFRPPPERHWHSYGDEPLPSGPVGPAFSCLCV